MANGHYQSELIGQQCLHLLLPHTWAIAITAARVTHDEQLVSGREGRATDSAPPVSDPLDGKLGRIGRLTDIQIAAVVGQIVQAIRHGFTQGVLRKIMFVHGVRGLTPALARVLEVADQLFFLGVHADHGQTRLKKGLFLLLQIDKLLVSIRVRCARQAFDVDLQRIVQFAQQSSHGRMADFLTQLLTQMAQAAPAPLARAHRVAGRLRLHQGLQLLDEFGVFFSTGGWPPPDRRTRSWGRSANSASSSRRPRRMVSTSKPVICASKLSPP